jgi:PKD repeat protein
VVLALLAPAAAQAATYTVDPADSNSGCTGTDTTCPSIGQALQAAKAADTIKILKGTYAEAVNVAAGKDGLKLEGAGLGDVKITGSGTTDVISIASKDVALSGVTVDVPTNAQSAVAVAETGAKLTAVVLQRSASSTENVPVVDITDAGAAAIASAFIVQGAGSAGTPAVRSTGAGGVTVADTLIVNSVGPGVVVEGGEGNSIVRSTIASTEPASDAVQVLSNDAGARKLTLDSSIMIGGANAAGLLARSSTAAAGDIALQVRHVTIAGSASGIVLDASGASRTVLQGGAIGNIDADVFSSIVHGVSSAKRHAPTIPGISGTANTASLTFANSDAPPAGEGNGTVEMGGASNTEDAKLFAPKSLKLRADAPVIDKGGALQAGESVTDVDGNPRTVGAASDIGADEYVNQPPKALFGITNKNPRQGEAIGFVSGSTDPEQGAGGGITEYRWDFGDGQKETTKVGGVAHTYTQVGTYNATLQVVDTQGLVSEVTPAQQVVVKDGVPPGVAIAAPVEGAKLNLKSTYLLGAKRPKPLQLTVLGAVGDASGVESVEVALYITKRDKVKKAKKKKRASKSAVAQCEFYSGRLFTKKKDCTKETWVKATLVPGGWTLKTRKGLRLPAGRYTVKVRARDKSGLLTTEFTTKAKTLVNFRVR